MAMTTTAVPATNATAVVDSKVPTMHAILFIDDWMLDGLYDVERVFPTPRQETLAGADDLGLSTIIYDPECKQFRAWTKNLNEPTARLHESEDGVNWRPTEHKRELYPRQNFYEQTWFYDPWDSDPERRH